MPTWILSWARRALIAASVISLLVAIVAAFAVMVRFSVELRHGHGAKSAQEPSTKPADPPSFPAGDYHAGQFPALSVAPREPLLGVNYTHYAFRRCALRGTGIVATYHRPGVATRVHEQLQDMRSAGIATLRTIIWHMTDPGGQRWGPIPSAGGRLREPYRTNLISFFSEIRRFGFARLTIAFGPRGSNSPLRHAVRPRTFRENWEFIRIVRSLAKRYGPARTRIDLINEGAPSSVPTDWSPAPRQTRRYLRAIYRLYIRRYGNRDVTVSAIANEPINVADRVRTLVRTLRSTGEPMPRWYDVHIPYERYGAARALRRIDSVLTRLRQPQPLVIGETGYDNRGIASSIREFGRSSPRQIAEVSPWYQRTQTGCQVRPPYVPGAYARVLAK